MSKLVIGDITTSYASTDALNAAFAAIETSLENTLSRDGTSPNQMNASLDMNGYAILNARATSGNENFIWLGTWATGTVYAVNNLVYAPEGSNIGNTLICVTANTAGATLDGDAANWAVFAQRGASGAGTGDVIGPASSTADSLARFNGTTGKLLKDGAVIGVDVQAYSANLAALSTFTADIDGTFAANSDTKFATQKATKTYVDILPRVRQVVYTQSSTSATGTATIPVDDTIPQNTEGTEFITATITPLSATSTLHIQANLIVSSSAIEHVVAALFQDTTANALTATLSRSDATNGMYTLTIDYLMTSGTTSATTFKIRIGANSASTITFNGFNGTRVFGTIPKSVLTITEYY